MAKVRKRVAAVVRERYDWDYLWMLAFTALLFFRPQDQIPGLEALHLAELTAIGGLAAMVVRRLSAGQTIAHINGEVIGVLALGAVIVLTIPFSFWPGGSLKLFSDIYVKDLITGEIAMVSVDVDGTQSPSGSDNAIWSPDGLYVGFYSDNLVRPDTNGGSEVYMARLLLPAAYVEGGPAVQIVPMARALDFGSPNYDQGSLTVEITGGSVAGDLLTLAQSSAPGESIALSGNQVLVNGVMVGTIDGAATYLSIIFNANANNPVVELLTEAVRISSTSADPTAAVRTITFTLVDGDGTADGVSDTTSFTRKVAFLPVDAVADQQLIGTPGPDSLVGGGGNDVLDGLGSADTMAGHAGNDVYFVDTFDDVVTEAAGQGRDLVYTSASFQLTAQQRSRRPSVATAATT